ERNYIVKVVYLPDPQFQDSAASGPDEIDSRRLEPGQDPIQEALRRGSILLVVRIGNIDQEVPNTPSMTAPPPGMRMPPLMGPPGMPVGFQVPYFGGGTPGELEMPTGPGPGLGILKPFPIPVPGGLGSDANRRPASVLPPLPAEQGNRGPLVLPFDEPGGVRPDVPSPTLRKDPDRLSPFAPLPPMPDVKFPGEENPNSLPTLPP